MFDGGSRRSFLRQLGVGVVPWLIMGCSKSASHLPGPANVEYYTCAMHPNVHAHDPHERCPICGMDLIPVYQRPPPSAAVSSPALVPTDSTREFSISPERLQAMGVRSESVRRGRMQSLLKAPAMVAIDEGGLRDINVKAPGYILKLHANYVGKWVEKGEPLMTVLCEGWIDAQIQYVKAYRSYRRSTEGSAAMRNSVVADRAIERMRARLRVWDLDPAQMANLEKFAMEGSDFDVTTGQGLKGTFDLLSPITGHVQTRSVVEGQHFEAGRSLLQIVDLAKVWVEAEFPEEQSESLALGTEMTLRFPALPNQSFRSRVEFIYPHLMEDSRRQRIRFVLDNPGHRLRPGMYGTVEGGMDQGERLLVPASAVIPTGERYLVFLDRGQGRLAPRWIQVGMRSGDQYEVVSGLNENDRVITRANFLIDAESRIQDALKTWGEEPVVDAPVPSDPPMPQSPAGQMLHRP